MISSPGLLISCACLISCVGLISGALVSGSLAAHDRITTKVTWDREIAPIVRARCVACHSAGGRGPMPLSTYEEARPWAKAIKEEVLARRMPKWPVMRGYGDFKNDPSLSALEIALVAAWADGGAPAFAKATAGRPDSPEATAGRPASKTVASGRAPVDKTTDKPAIKPPRTREVRQPCAAQTLPPGRLVALRPALEKGQTLRLTLVRDDGMQEPLLWLRDFDPAFAETYWLRTPARITNRTRLRAEAPTPCTLTVLLESGTGR